MAERKDPYRNTRFLLEIGGLIRAGFSEVTIPDASADVIEYREGNEEPRLRKLSGLNKYSNLVLKGGVTDSMELFDWMKLITQGKIKDARKAIAIIVMDEEGSPGARWEFENAWPSKYDPPDLNAKGNDVTIETIEITHEGMKRVS